MDSRDETCLSFLVVIVSVPVLVNVNEGVGMVEVCAVLSATEDTERNFSISLATTDNTGKQRLSCIVKWYTLSMQVYH